MRVEPSFAEASAGKLDIRLLDQFPKNRILEHLSVVHPFPVDAKLRVDEPEALAIIDIPPHMAQVERLDGFSVEPMPAVDSHSIVLGVLFEPVGLNDIFLDTGDQSFSPLTLSLYDQMVLPEGGGAVAVRVHRHGF